MTDEKVLLLIRHVYDAVGDPQKWNTFLEQFAMAIHGKTTTFVVFDKNESRGNVSTALHADPESQHKYDDYYSAIDSWYQHGKHLLKTGSVVTGQMLCPDRVLEKSEFYNDFLKPIGDYHEICGVISSEDRLLSMITCMRAKRYGPFEDEECRLLSILMPHLQTAVQLHRKVVAIENQKTLAESALDRFEVGLFVIDAQGKVLLMNRTARVICERSDGLAVTGNSLRAQKPDEQRRLAELVRGAVAPMSKSSVGSGGAVKISRPSLRRPFHVLVGPFQAQGPWLPAKHAAALVFVTDPDSQALPDTELFEHYFGLTRAESRLAAGIMQGKSLGILAEEFQLTRNTVHTQLQTIFEKTETHRQGELVRLLLASSFHLQAKQ